MPGLFLWRCATRCVDLPPLIWPVPNCPGGGSQSRACRAERRRRSLGLPQRVARPPKSPAFQPRETACEAAIRGTGAPVFLLSSVGGAAAACAYTKTVFHAPDIRAWLVHRGRRERAALCPVLRPSPCLADVAAHMSSRTAVIHQ